MCLGARHLSACLFHVSASGAIIAAATANSRRLSQQNPYETCVSLVELGQTSRHFLVHFEKIPTKIILRYGRCAVCCVPLFQIPGVSNAKASHFLFCFYAQVLRRCTFRILVPGRMLEDSELLLLYVAKGNNEWLWKLIEVRIDYKTTYIYKKEAA